MNATDSPATKRMYGSFGVALDLSYKLRKLKYKKMANLKFIIKARPKREQKQKR